MANTSEHMSIRLPKNLAERVRARAVAEGRSVSGMMTRLVQWAMEGRVDEPTAIVGTPVHPFDFSMEYRESIGNLTQYMGAAVPVQNGRDAHVPSDGAALSRANKAVPARSSIQPVDGAAVFVDQPRKVVHGAVERTVEYEE